MRNRLAQLSIFFLMAISALACTTEDQRDRFGLRDEEVGSVTLGLSKCDGGSVGVHDYCTDPMCPCVVGEGDCDRDSDCDQTTPVGTLVCGLNNGAKFGRAAAEDVCWPPHCENGVIDGDETSLDCGGSCGTVCVCDTGSNGDGEYCTPSCKCSSGEGDCDSDNDCDQSGTPLSCVNNIGAEYGQDPGNDVCIPTHCTNSTEDGDETGVDCGGSCPACAVSALSRLNVDSVGAQADDRVQLIYDISPDGRYVVFASRRHEPRSGRQRDQRRVLPRPRYRCDRARVDVRGGCAG